MMHRQLRRGCKAGESRKEGDRAWFACGREFVLDGKCEKGWLPDAYHFIRCLPSLHSQQEGLTLAGPLHPIVASEKRASASACSG
jgi:hypothetical protein